MGRFRWGRNALKWTESAKEQTGRGVALVLRWCVAVLVAVSMFCSAAWAQVCRVGCPCGNACIDCSDTCRVGGGEARSGRTGSSNDALVVVGIVVGVAVLAASFLVPLAIASWSASYNTGLAETATLSAAELEKAKQKRRDKEKQSLRDKAKMSPEAREIEEAIEAQESADFEARVRAAEKEAESKSYEDGEDEEGDGEEEEEAQESKEAFEARIDAAEKAKRERARQRQESWP